MITADECRIYPEGCRWMAKSNHTPIERRNWGQAMAREWDALAEGIDRDKARQLLVRITTDDAAAPPPRPAAN